MAMGPKNVSIINNELTQVIVIVEELRARDSSEFVVFVCIYFVWKLCFVCAHFVLFSSVPLSHSSGGSQSDSPRASLNY